MNAIERIVSDAPVPPHTTERPFPLTRHKTEHSGFFRVEDLEPTRPYNPPPALRDADGEEEAVFPLYR